MSKVRPMPAVRDILWEEDIMRRTELPVSPFHPHPLAAALLAALFAAAPAMAQQADPPATGAATTLDQVQVTGIRESMQSSINKKRDDTVISDVLSAEDIGDLPAPSLADAIETLTGAASTRDKTGASEISIRGLGAFLSSTNFNGREITGWSDWMASSQQSARSRTARRGVRA